MKLKCALLASLVALTMAAADLTVLWDPVAPRPGEVIGYRLERQMPSGWVVQTRTASTNFVMTNVPPGSYVFSVFATNQFRVESARSDTAATNISDIQVTPPGTPQNVRVVVVVTVP